MEKRWTGDQHRVGLSPRQSILKAFTECSMLLARRAARGLQCLLIYVHTGNRREIGVLGDKVQPVTPPAADSNVDNFDAHCSYLIISKISDTAYRLCDRSEKKDYCLARAIICIDLFQGDRENMKSASTNGFIDFHSTL
jgi:hypothetical protein